MFTAFENLFEKLMSEGYGEEGIYITIYSFDIDEMVDFA